jgi:hypothetical protein
MPDTAAVIQAIAQFAFSIIVLLLPFVIKGLFPQIEAFIKARAHGAAWDVVIAAAGDVVRQVEQLRKAGLVPDNETAVRRATLLLHDWLILRGIDLPIDQLTTAIESAVHDLPRETQEVPATTAVPVAAPASKD